MQGRPLTAARPSGNGGAKLFTLLVVLLPLTYQIASPFPFLSLGELVLVPFVFVLLVTGIRDGVYSPAALSVFYLVPIGATFVDFFLYSGAYLLIADSFTVMARILFYYALIVVSTKYFAKDFALKCYWGAIVVLMAVLVAQLFAHYALGLSLIHIYLQGGRSGRPLRRRREGGHRVHDRLPEGRNLHRERAYAL